MSYAIQVKQSDGIFFAGRRRRRHQKSFAGQYYRRTIGQTKKQRQSAHIHLR
jgi:hypothetical protein